MTGTSSSSGGFRISSMPSVPGSIGFNRTRAGLCVSTRSASLSWVAGHERGVAGPEERLPHVAQRLWVVVDDQDAGRLPGRLPPFHR